MSRSLEILAAGMLMVLAWRRLQGRGKRRGRWCIHPRRIPCWRETRRRDAPTARL